MTTEEEPDEGTETPKGVGESTTRRGEDIKAKDGKEAGREDVAPSGGTDRPAGTSTKRDVSGVSST